MAGAEWMRTLANETVCSTEIQAWPLSNGGGPETRAGLASAHMQKESLMSIEARLADLGVSLPDAQAPAANYVPFVQVGDIVYVSGQISNGPDGLITGKLGADMDVEAGAAAAKTCAISLLAQVKAACGGDIERLVRVVKLTGFVNSTADFTAQPQVINGASDFLVEALGDAGRHSRSAVSAASLPLGVAVEIEGIFQIR